MTKISQLISKFINKHGSTLMYATTGSILALTIIAAVDGFIYRPELQGLKETDERLQQQIDDVNQKTRSTQETQKNESIERFMDDLYNRNQRLLALQEESAGQMRSFGQDYWNWTSDEVEYAENKIEAMEYLCNEIILMVPPKEVELIHGHFVLAADNYRHAHRNMLKALKGGGEPYMKEYDRLFARGDYHFSNGAELANEWELKQENSRL